MPGLRRDLAVDFGTTTIRVAEPGGEVVREPSLVAVEQRSGAVVAMGAASSAAAEARPGDVLVERPLAGGAIVDQLTAVRCLALLLQRLGAGRMARVRATVGVPATCTAVERRALAEAVRLAGASTVLLVEAPFAAAVGAGLPVGEPVANVVVDVGGGVTQAAVVALDGVVARAGARVGGFELDAALRAHVRARAGVALGDRAVEQLKQGLGAAVPRRDDASAEARGRDLATGAAAVVRLTGAEVRAALDGVLEAVVDVVRRALGECPPELLRDVPETGARLVGGGALLPGLDERIADGAQLPTVVAADPLDAVVRGLALLSASTR